MSDSERKKKKEGQRDWRNDLADAQKALKDASDPVAVSTLVTRIQSLVLESDRMPLAQAYETILHAAQEGTAKEALHGSDQVAQFALISLNNTIGQIGLLLAQELSHQQVVPAGEAPSTSRRSSNSPSRPTVRPGTRSQPNA